ncbi:MAG: transcriptional repressor [Tannerella sp.]|nr:transcriptional repressor [Tannerella sp.]
MDKQKRNTKTKQMVTNVLLNSPSALCHEDIERELSGKIDRVTIYRILQNFCDEGKVHKITSGGGKTYYALCRHCSVGKHDDNHLHFHCLRCNTVSCLDETVGTPSLAPGYEIRTVFCTVSGYCPNCLNEQNEKVKV